MNPFPHQFIFPSNQDNLQMPVMDGFQATRLLREKEVLNGKKKGTTERMPVIAITASATADMRQQCVTAGMDDWMPKPFAKDKLCHVLNRWLGGAVSRIECHGIGTSFNNNNPESCGTQDTREPDCELLGKANQCATDYADHVKDGLNEATSTQSDAQK